jgi:hypothetical protein
VGKLTFFYFFIIFFDVFGKNDFDCRIDYSRKDSI